MLQRDARASKERIGRILQMHANHREEREKIGAGEIAAAVGLKFTTTGDTLCDQGQPDPARVDRVPRARHRAGRRAEDEGRPGQARDRRSAASPRRTRPSACSTDEETGQTLIAGMGELHLEIIVDRLLREFNVDANVGKPQVAYRETDRASSSRRCRASSCARPAAAASTATPSSRSSRTSRAAGYEFVNKIIGGVIPKEYITSVDQGIQEAMESGVVAGYPVVDVKVTLIDGSLPRRRLVRDGVQGRRLDGVQGRHAARPSRCCSSPSSRSRSSRPRSTWATSSATSTRGAAASRAWSPAATRRSSRPACRSPRCSATRPTCAP